MTEELRKQVCLYFTFAFLASIIACIVIDFRVVNPLEAHVKDRTLRWMGDISYVSQITSDWNSIPYVDIKVMQQCSGEY